MPLVRPLADRARMRAGALVVDSSFRALSALGKLHPHAREARRGIVVERDVAYRDTGRAEHRLDIYRPARAEGPLPVVLYVHGGGFRILSKDTHWLMGLSFARRGYLVFSINYRLAPEHPYPAALEDVSHAYQWLARNAARHGGDLTRLVLAGESAGANLVTTLAIASAHQRPEPFARAVFDTDLRPAAVLPACGIFQVSDVERLTRRRALPVWVADRLQEVSDAYLDRATAHPQGGTELADPLLLLESGRAFERELPPFLTFVGTRDPLLDDTRRLKAALDRRGVPCEALYYPGEVHAFHALVWRPHATASWNESFRFLDAVLAKK